MIAQAVPDWKKPDCRKTGAGCWLFPWDCTCYYWYFSSNVVPRGQAIRPLEAAYTVNLISPGEGPVGGPEAPRAADPVPLPSPAKPVSPKEVPPSAKPVPPKEVPPPKEVVKLPRTRGPPVPG